MLSMISVVHVYIILFNCVLNMQARELDTQVVGVAKPDTVQPSEAVQVINDMGIMTNSFTNFLKFRVLCQ